MPDHSQLQSDYEKRRSTRYSSKHFRVAVKFVPVTAEQLHRQFVALFDLLGMDAELFDNSSADPTIEEHQ